ncbi:MAG: hypothetical protein K2N14_01240 [Clostridia bacterium]|nr:hypothetical protein [Clostridia bacterium]
MTVLKYMAMQKDNIIKKHLGETFLYTGGSEGVQVVEKSAYEILREIDAMEGLNVKERMSARFNCLKRELYN